MFRWTEAVGGGGEAKWENLGPLESPTRKVEFEGRLYDKVCYVHVYFWLKYFCIYGAKLVSACDADTATRLPICTTDLAVQSCTVGWVV